MFLYWKQGKKKSKARKVKKRLQKKHYSKNVKIMDEKTTYERQRTRGARRRMGQYEGDRVRIFVDRLLMIAIDPNPFFD